MEEESLPLIYHALKGTLAHLGGTMSRRRVKVLTED